MPCITSVELMSDWDLKTRCEDPGGFKDGEVIRCWRCLFCREVEKRLDEADQDAHDRAVNPRKFDDD